MEIKFKVLYQIEKEGKGIFNQANSVRHSKAWSTNILKVKLEKSTNMGVYRIGTVRLSFLFSYYPTKMGSKGKSKYTQKY